MVHELQRFYMLLMLTNEFHFLLENFFPNKTGKAIALVFSGKYFFEGVSLAMYFYLLKIIAVTFPDRNSVHILPEFISECEINVTVHTDLKPFYAFLILTNEFSLKNNQTIESNAILNSSIPS